MKYISDLGDTIIISSEVSPASDLSVQLSKKFNCILLVPLISMLADEKKEISRVYMNLQGLKIRNTHESDALATVVKAYQYYEKKFRKIEARINNQNVKISINEVKELVIKGYNLKKSVL